jgi:hypothetical protein
MASQPKEPNLTKRPPGRSEGELGRLRMSVSRMRKGSRPKRKSQSEWVNL